jgi:hypothetical protein
MQFLQTVAPSGRAQIGGLDRPSGASIHG